MSADPVLGWWWYITDLPRGKGGLPPGDHWVAGRGHRHSGTTWAICPSVHWWVSLKSVNIIMVTVRCWFFNCLHFFYIGILLGKKKKWSSPFHSYPLCKLLDWTQNSFFIQHVIICPVIVSLYILLLKLSKMLPWNISYLLAQQDVPGSRCAFLSVFQPCKRLFLREAFLCSF